MRGQSLGHAGVRSSDKDKFPSFWVVHSWVAFHLFEYLPCAIGGLSPTHTSADLRNLSGTAKSAIEKPWQCRFCIWRMSVPVFSRGGRQRPCPWLCHGGDGPVGSQCALVVVLPFPSDAGVHPQILLQLLLCQPQENVPIHLVILPREI